MKDKLEEARDILHGYLCRQGQPPKALARVARLLEEVLADWWDEDEIVGLADEDLLELDVDSEPFPAA